MMVVPKPKKLTTDMVQERRVRPIYELLDSGNNKKALIEVDRMLRKMPNDDLAQVVKALTLIRMHKDAEARSILDQVMAVAEKEGLFVGDTTQMLMTCYKELNEPQMICTILESLSSQLQTEDMYVQYFMSLIRVQDFRKMNQIAMKLFKTFKNHAYFSWVIASLVLHQLDFMGPLNYSDTLSFELAERMIDKFLLDLKEINLPLIDSWNLLDLYIQLMIRHSTKWEKILGIFETKGYPPQDLSSWKWDAEHENYCFVMDKAGLGSQLLTHLKSLFIQHKDYALLKQIVDLFGKNEVTRNDVTEFMDDLRTNHASFAVAMGNLYFTTQMKDTFSEADQNERIEKDLKMAIQFGAEKTNFFPDTVEQFKLVDHAMQCQLLKGMELPSTAGDLEKVDIEMSTVEIIKDINYELTQRDVMGKTMDLQQRLKHADFCFGKYLRLKEAYDKRTGGVTDTSGTATEEGNEMKDIDYLDQYVLVAASILLSERFKLGRKSIDMELCQTLESMAVGEDMANSKRKNVGKAEQDFQDELLVSAICIMEYCLARSPQNCTLRFVLANAYAHLGATQEMWKVLEGVNIKHVQLETLGYLLFPLVLTTGLYADSTVLLGQADFIYSTYENETMEYVISAYDYCHFRQALEFGAFRNQLMQSTQCGSVIVEKRLLGYMLQTTSMHILKKHTEKILQELDLSQLMEIACVDNRDLTVLHNLFDDEMNWSDFRETTGMLDILWFKMRLSLLTIITKLITTGMKLQEEQVTDAEIADLQNAVKTWEDFSAKLSMRKVEKWQETPYFGFYPPRHTRHFQLSIPDKVTEQVDCVIKIMNEKSYMTAMEHLKKLEHVMGQHATSLLKVLEKSVTIYKTDSNYNRADSCIQDCHFILEFFSLSKIFLAVAVTAARAIFDEEAKTGKNSKGKKGKFGKEVSLVISNILANFQKLHELLGELITFLNAKAVQSWPNKKWMEGCAFVDTMETKCILSAFPSTYNDVQTKIRDSHLDQILQMSTVAETMLQFIRSM